MKFKETINEGVSLKVGDFVYDNYKYDSFFSAYEIIAQLENGWLATSEISDKPLKKSEIHFEICCWFDDNCRQDGKRPYSIFNGNRKDFLKFCEDKMY